tara:strand:+ start:139 stop:594 length:456 start_codon:yes stop_codon:yes gene_type:complete
MPKKVKSKNVYHQQATRSNRKITEYSHLPKEIERLRAELVELRASKEMAFDAIEIQVSTSLREMSKEVIEAYLASVRREIAESEKQTREMIERELKEIRNKLQSSLATVNTRVKRYFEAIEHDMQTLFKHTEYNFGTKGKERRDKRYEGLR